MKRRKALLPTKRWNYIADVFRDEREIKLMSSKARKFYTMKTKTYFAHKVFLAENIKMYVIERKTKTHFVENTFVFLKN